MGEGWDGGSQTAEKTPSPRGGRLGWGHPDCNGFLFKSLIFKLNNIIMFNFLSDDTNNYIISNKKASKISLRVGFVA